MRSAAGETDPKFIDDGRRSQPGLEFNPNGSPPCHQWSQSTPWGSSDQAPEPPPKSDASYGRPWPAVQPEACRDQRRRILGLTVPVFWAIVISLVVIAAAAIGGGIAGGLAAQQRSSNSNSTSTPSALAQTSAARASSTETSGSTTTMTTTTSAAAGATSPAPSDGGCPGINGTMYTPLNADGQDIVVSSGALAQSFVELCDTNYPSGAVYGNPGIHDILTLYLPTLEDCIAACASYNANYQVGLDNGVDVGGGFCRSVAIVKRPGEYCYLKNGTGTNNTFGAPSFYSSAVLVSGLGN